MSIYKKCVVCDADFTVPKCRALTAKYCSYPCRYESMRGNDMHKGHAHSPEARKKMSIAKQEYIARLSDEEKRAIATKLMGNTNAKGNRWSQESREKLSEVVKKRYEDRDKHPRWKGGQIIDKDGYVRLRQKDQTYKLRSRIVCEENIGRELRETEIVHHIDQDQRNDVIENLFLFRHQAAHRRWHGFIERHNLDGRILKTNLI